MASFYFKIQLLNKKSDLLICLDGSTCTTENPITSHAKIFDGPAVVHSLSTKQAATFVSFLLERKETKV